MAELSNDLRAPEITPVCLLTYRAYVYVCMCVGGSVSARTSNLAGFLKHAKVLFSLDF